MSTKASNYWCACCEPDEDSNDNVIVEKPPMSDEDLLLESFNLYVTIAESLKKNLLRPKDVELTDKLIEHCSRMMHCRQINVLRVTLKYFRYALRCLDYTSLHQPVALFRQWYGCNQMPPKPVVQKCWLKPNENLIATKTMSDGYTVIYHAIAFRPEAGWQEGALKLLVEHNQRKYQDQCWRQEHTKQRMSYSDYDQSLYKYARK